MADLPRSLNLTHAQRAGLRKLEPVHLGGKGKCPVEPGHTLEVARNLTLTVTKVKPVKGGGWKLMYTLHDTRDLEQAHHLRSTPPVHVEDGKAPTPDSIAQAREESSYTARGDAMAAGHAPPTEWVDKHAQERRQDFVRGKAERAKERLSQPAEDTLREELKALRAEAPKDAALYEAKVRDLADRVAAKRRRRAA